MKKKNERCPLQNECGRVCKFERQEKECDYYKGNSRPGYQITDQEGYETLPEDSNSEITLNVTAPGEQTQALVMVDVDKIFPHPKNPRKKLGDLTELADSIKSSGVLQNLTIVPKPDGPEGCYYAVIGHRRHAGAKKAGLKQVPCVISRMDEKEQVRTMMVENMQRSDLTVYEEAEGFQMMLDLGDTVSDISAKTGFSDTTVRHRVKLLELDKEKFQKAADRDATLHDYMALEKIKDIALRNEVLETIGTANFNYTLKRAKEKEESAEKKAALKAVIDTFAAEIKPEEAVNYKQVKYISLWSNMEFEKPEDAGTKKYFYTVFMSSINLYVEKAEHDQAEDLVMKEKQRQLREKKEEFDKIAARSYQLRFDFVKGLTGLKKKNAIICEMVVQSMLYLYGGNFDEEVFAELLDLEVNDNEDLDISCVTEMIKTSPERILIATAYANFGDRIGEWYHNWQGQYKENEKLDILYSCLEQLGYEISDEEKSYREGTHTLFAEVEQ